MADHARDAQRHHARPDDGAAQVESHPGRVRAGSRGRAAGAGREGGGGGGDAGARARSVSLRRSVMDDAEESSHIAIDLGAESGRVILGRLRGGRVEIEEVHRFPNGAIKIAGTLRWDVLRIFDEIKTGLR